MFTVSLTSYYNEIPHQNSNGRRNEWAEWGWQRCAMQVRNVEEVITKGLSADISLA